MKDFLLATEALISAATPKSARHRKHSRCWVGIVQLVLCVCAPTRVSTDPVSHLLALSEGCWLPVEEHTCLGLCWHEIRKSQKCVFCFTLMSLCILPVSCKWYKPCQKAHKNQCTFLSRPGNNKHIIHCIVCLYCIAANCVCVCVQEIFFNNLPVVRFVSAHLSVLPCVSVLPYIFWVVCKTFPKLYTKQKDAVAVV